MLNEREADLRRHARVQIAWRVTVEAQGTTYQVQTINMSPLAAKLTAGELPLTAGSLAHLHIHPPVGEPLDLEAIVWRTDPDGTVFFFIGLGVYDSVLQEALEEPEKDPCQNPEGQMAR